MTVCQGPVPLPFPAAWHWERAGATPPFCLRVHQRIWCKEKGWGRYRQQGCRAGETPSVFPAKVLRLVRLFFSPSSDYQKERGDIRLGEDSQSPDHMSFGVACTMAVPYLQKGTDPSLQGFAGEGIDLSLDLILTEADDEKTVC